MKPRISLVTLAVDDLSRAVAFYRDGLGLRTKGIVGEELEHGAVAFFELDGGLGLALWPRTSLAHDTGMPVSSAAPPSVGLAHNVGGRAEVHDVIEQARRAGAAIVKEPRETFWGGVAGYFTDPDGHLWEVAWNPARLPEDGP